MPYRQITAPNLNVPAKRGWCLKYVDDTVNAPARQPSAQAAFDVENRNGNIRTSDLPVSIWAPIFLSLNSGAYKGLGHVAWACNHGNRLEIRDSETASGARQPYGSINELLAWFANFAPKYLGWSLWVDGRRIVEEYSQPSPSGLVSQNGTFKANRDMKIRYTPNTSKASDDEWRSAGSPIIKTGETRKYDNYVDSDGIRWISYVGQNSGRRCYIARKRLDGSEIYGEAY